MMHPVVFGKIGLLQNLGKVLLLILFFTFIVSSCGIQDMPYYYPPSLSDSGESQISFNMVHDLQNHDPTSGIQYFLGYEVYYRAYSSSADAESAISAMTAESERSGSSPISAFSKLESLGFRRFFGFDGINYSEIRPLFGDFPINTGIYFTVYLKDSEAWYFTVNGADPGILANRTYIARYVAGTTTAKMFHESSAWVVGDPDYTGSNSSPQTLYFVFYGIGMGQDPQDPLSTYPSYPSTLRSSGYFTYNLR